jgi:hypothetical protein
MIRVVRLWLVWLAIGLGPLKISQVPAVAVSEHLKTPTYLIVCPTIPGPPSPHYVAIRSAPFIFLPGIMDPPTRSNSRRRNAPARALKSKCDMTI